MRLLVATIAITLIGLPTLYFAHSHQTTRTAEVFLARAEAMEQAQRWSDAVEYLKRYSRLRPYDASVHVRIAEDFDQVAQNGRGAGVAIALFYRAIGVEPRRGDLRQRLITYLMQQRKWSAAKEQAVALRELPGKDNQQVAARIAAILSLEEADTGGVVAIRSAWQKLQEVCREFPEDVAAASALSNLLRQRADDLGLDVGQAETSADAVMDAMVAANSIAEQARLQRYAYRKRYNLPGATDDLEAALKAAPKNVVVLVAGGEHFLTSSDRTLDQSRARECFAAAIEIAPRLAQAHIGLGQALQAAGDARGAERAWKRGLELVGNDVVGLHNALFQNYLAQRDLTSASVTLRELTSVLDGQATELRREERRLLTRLEAQLHLAKGQAGGAVALLKMSLERSPNDPAAPRIDTSDMDDRRTLAQAYVALKCWDLAALELEKLAEHYPQAHEPHMAAAEAWRNAGHLGKSISALARASQRTSAPAHVWLQLAEAHLQIQMASAQVGERNWSEFREALNQAKERLPGAWEVAVMEAEYLAAEGSAAGARHALAKLGAVEQSHANTPLLWRRLPGLYQRLGETAAADRALRRLVVLEPNAVETVLVTAGLLAARKNYAAADVSLSKALESASGAGNRVVYERRIAIAIAAGHYDLARRAVDDALHAQPNDMDLLRRAIDLAALEKDWGAAAGFENQMRDLEGDSGVIWRLYRARRLLLAERPRAAVLSEVRELLARIEEMRPGWSSATLLSGFAAEIEGNVEAAVQRYNLALDQGERGAETYERLMSLLLSVNRLAEANAVLERMQRIGVSSTGIHSLSIELYARQDQFDRALDLARRAVAEAPRDAMRRVWLANMLALHKEPERALAEFQEAVRLAPADLRVFSGLFTFHRMQGDMEKAEKTLLAMTTRSNVSAAQKAFLLGQGYELLGKTSEAEQSLLEAVRLSPDDVPTLLRLAALQVNVDKAAARATLEKVLSIDPNVHVARRTLATVIAASQGDDGWDEAQKLLAKNADAEQAPADNARLRALLLARRSGNKETQLAALSEARGIMELRVKVEGRAEALDRTILAEILERQARLNADPTLYVAARSHLRHLVDRKSAGVSDLHGYVAFLLRMAASEAILKHVTGVHPSSPELWADAERRLDEIERLERDTKRFPSPETLVLRVKLLKTRGRQSDAVALVDAQGNEGLATLADTSRRCAWMNAVARLHESLGNPTAAEAWLRKAHVESGHSFVPLAEFLARHDRLVEAIAVCQAAMASDSSPTPAIVMAKLAVSYRASSAEWTRIEPDLAKALERHPRHVELRFAVGLAHTVSGRTEDAIANFERVVEVDSRHILALNNLATLLAEDAERRPEAIKHIEQALRVGGRQPMLLDTQGMIYLLEENADRAASALSEAVASGADDARYWLHLAAAYQLQGRSEQAKSAYARARQGGLDHQVLTASDARFKQTLEELL